MKIKPTMVLDFKAAQPDDRPLVMEILAEAAAWLQEKGIDQWPSPPNEHWQRRMAEAVQREEVYTVGIVKNRFGIVRFTWSDPYWPDDNLAGYVHSMAVRSEMHGQNLGGLILFWAMMKAKREGKQFLRLDCAAGNGRLRRYYEEQGFVCRGEVVDRDYVAALYELDLREFGLLKG
jgi:GNAT superfamily N-acetyltransferase